MSHGRFPAPDVRDKAQQASCLKACKDIQRLFCEPVEFYTGHIVMKHQNIFKKTLALFATLLAFVLMASSANAQSLNVREKVQQEYSAYWHKAKHQLGTRAPGRNIRKWGVETSSGKVRKARISELRQSTLRLKSMTAPAPQPVASPASASSTPSASSATDNTTAASAQQNTSSSGIPSNLASIAQCESGGNPNAVSPDGQYHGLYQMSQETYSNYGGRGSVSGASVAEQTRIAQKLPRSSWPNC